MNLKLTESQALTTRRVRTDEKRRVKGFAFLKEQNGYITSERDRAIEQYDSFTIS